MRAIVVIIVLPHSIFYSHFSFNTNLSNVLIYINRQV